MSANTPEPPPVQQVSVVIETTDTSVEVRDQ